MTEQRLADLQCEIRACRRCVEAGHIPVANPILRGNLGARIMVIGQAPGPGAAERPVPYSGASGKTLQTWMARAGFPPDAFHDPDRFYLTSLTKCFPGRAGSGSGDRAPSRREIQLCLDHLRAELRLVRPELVLSLGRLSVNTLLPSMKKRPLNQVIGRPMPAELTDAGDALVLPLPHPSGVSRWLNLSENQQHLTNALDWLSRERDRRGW